MFTADAIKELSQSEAIKAANESVTKAAQDAHVVGLPGEFSMHDLEKYLPTRRRARGIMTTSVTDHFAKYTGMHAEDGACAFVSPEKMQAVAVLNLGSKDKPGHTDNLAVLELKKTAAFNELLAIANGIQQTQRKVAEFMEDWQDYILCFSDSDTKMETKRAIAAVRSITIEALSKMDAHEENFGSTRSALDSVKASSKETLPAFFDFTCEPRHGLARRTFRVRIGIVTGSAAPSLTLRIIKLEEHEERMAEELAEIVGDAVKDSIPVVIGTYQAKQ
jgi:uncharacterized protein YfdQ (DUF2303 family)